MDDNFWYYSLMGAGGATAAELFKLYEFKAKLTASKYAKLVRSPLFYFSVVGMLAASGFICWAVNANAGSATEIQLLISGIGARSIARGAAVASARESGVPLGDDDDSISLGDVL